MNPGTESLDGHIADIQSRFDFTDKHLGPIFYAQHGIANVYRQAGMIMYNPDYERTNGFPIAQHFRHTIATVPELFSPMKGAHSQNAVRIISETDIRNTEVTFALNAINLLLRLPKIYNNEMDSWADEFRGGFSLSLDKDNDTITIKAGETAMTMPVADNTFVIIEKLTTQYLYTILNTPGFDKAMDRIVRVNSFLSSNARYYFGINKDNMGLIPNNPNGLLDYRKAMAPHKIELMHTIFGITFDVHYDLDLPSILERKGGAWDKFTAFHNFFMLINGMSEKYVFDI